VTILRLLRQHLAGHWFKFILYATLSAISSALVLAAVNAAAANLHDRDVMLTWLVLLVLSILIYGVSQKGLMLLAASVAENAVQQLRVEFLARLQTAELPEVERLNRSEIQTCLNAEMQVVADGGLQLMIIGQALVLIVVTMIYLAWVSLPALVIAAIFVAIGVSFYLSQKEQLRLHLRETFVLQTLMIAAFVDFLEGFKEVKLNVTRSSELAADIRQLSAALATKRLSTSELFTKVYVSGQITFYLLPGMMVFVVPLFTPISTQTVAMMTTSVLFLIGPITVVVSGLPILQRVNSAAETILAVQSLLSEIGQAPVGSPIDLTGFNRIELSELSYQYPASEDESGFAVGPISFEIERGQVVFITGGNGSGKSTLLKLIAGLYPASNGTLRLDGRPITAENIDAYRSLFAVIFSDYHLFKKLYGLPQVDPQRSEQLFRLLEMEGKSQIVDQAFSTVALSTGQRKRLAMIALLLEDKPICVFDEWAADQDPHFREKFYREILPALKAAGKTVIAITHDERYFAAADFRLHLEEGRLQPA